MRKNEEDHTKMTKIKTTTKRLTTILTAIIIQHSEKDRLFTVKHIRVNSSHQLMKSYSSAILIVSAIFYSEIVNRITYLQDYLLVQ